MNNKSKITAMTAAVLLSPASAFAHDGAHGALTVASGLAHPFTGWDHLVLLSLGGVLLGVTRPGLRLDARALLMLLAMLAAGAAAMMDHAALAALSFLVALAALALGDRRADRSSIMFAGGVAAAVAQMASHVLAWGDAPPSAGFAAGYSAASMGIFAAAWLVTRSLLTASWRTRAGS